MWKKGSQALNLTIKWCSPRFSRAQLSEESSYEVFLPPDCPVGRHTVSDSARGSKHASRRARRRSCQLHYADAGYHTSGDPIDSRNRSGPLERVDRKSTRL